MRRARIQTSVSFTALSMMTASAFGAGTNLWTDNFDSYADQAALLANYTGAGSTNTGGTTSQFFDLGVPTPDGGDTTQSVRYHDPLTSGTTMPDLARDINSGATPITPTDSAPILFQSDFYWDGGGNKRVTAGLRNVGGGGNTTGIIEMGYYNSAFNPITGVAGSGFAIRTVLIQGTGTGSGLPENAVANWRLLTLDSDPTQLLSAGVTGGSWIRFTALVRGHSVEYTADVNRDGSIDSSYIAATPTFDATTSIFNSVRMGGPSGLSSGGGGAYFDNLTVKTLIAGDANRDGKISADDYALVDRGSAKALAGWTNGDFTGDGHVDSADYLLIDQSYLAQGPADADGLIAQRAAQFGDAYASALLAAVPEPTSLLAACGLALPLLRRRRNR